jgi:hypothetical protein
MGVPSCDNGAAGDAGDTTIEASVEGPVDGDGKVAERCGAVLHATSIRQAIPTEQQPLPSAASRQSRDGVPGFRRLVSTPRQELCARMLGRQRRPSPGKADAHYTSRLPGRMCRALRGATNVVAVGRFAHNPRPHRSWSPAMHEGYRRLFASQAMQALLKREMTALTPILPGVYGNSGLFLGPPTSVSCALPPHLLGNIVALAPTDNDVFDGAVKTTTSALAFANDSFQLLIAQHSLELVDDVEACASEFSRVLAPEGTALVFGFNPFGTWRPWLALQAARGAPLHLRSSSEWRQLFARHQIDTLQVRHPGVLLPNDPAQPRSRYDQWLTNAFARFGSSWLLLARKRRSTLTPLRLRTPSRERAINPRFAPGAHRACA